MLIQPNTYVKLIKGCPLDNSYRDTIYFEDEAEQYAYFRDYVGDTIVLPKQSYQRYADGVITVNKVADELYGVNYMMFQNSSFGNKWFYAFVNEIEYVGNVVSRIYYEIDVLQTWMFNYEIYPCFVEREHSKTDGIGDNLVPESIAFGDYVIGETVTPFKNESVGVIVQYKDTLPDIDPMPDNVLKIQEGVYGGNYQGTNFQCFMISNQEEANELEKLIAALNITSFGGIVGIFIFPWELAGEYANSTFFPYGAMRNFQISRPNTLDGYTPKNKKLLTFPYVCANLCPNNSQGNDFAFEYFGGSAYVDGVAEFVITAGLYQGSNLIAFPVYYNGQYYDSTCAVQGATFPVCGYAGDTFSTWFANNSLSILGTAVGGLASSTGGMTKQGLLEVYEKHPVVRGSGKELKKRLAGLDDHMIDLHKINSAVREGARNAYVNEQFSNHGAEIGSVINGCLSGIQGASNYSSPQTNAMFSTPNGGYISARVKTIRKHNAKIVDDYFSMFGYATNNVKLPNRHVRKYWTYVKTNGFSAHGNVPASDMSLICDIHDKGITYWDKNSVVGDYSPIDNNPI